MNKKRCTWCTKDPLYIEYHDKEWAVPVHDDRKLFEMLSLEAFQAGLSWITILKKRESFRIAFDDFNPQIIALYQDDKVAELLQNKSIIRHKNKILATINNARAFIKVQNQYGSFDNFIWDYVKGKSIINHYSELSLVPSKTELSIKLSNDLKNLGFKFVGATIIYSFMQAVGMVNDHTTDCFLYRG